MLIIYHICETCIQKLKSQVEIQNFFIKSVPKYQTWTENKDHKEVKFVVYDAMK